MKIFVHQFASVYNNESIYQNSRLLTQFSNSKFKSSEALAKEKQVHSPGFMW